MPNFGNDSGSVYAAAFDRDLTVRTLFWIRLERQQCGARRPITTIFYQRAAPSCRVAPTTDYSTGANP